MPRSAVGILGIGAAVPEKVLTNADLEKIVDTSDEWITTRTGIKERRIAEEAEAASHFAVRAASKAIEDAGLMPEDIDMIICATVTPDMPFPATACLVQDRLGIKNVPAFDLSAGCSGFTYALAVGTQMAQGDYEHVLVIGVDILSRITDYSDRSTCVLFGDGAGAAVLGPVPEGYGVLAVDLGADGSGAEHLQLPAGGSLRPPSLKTISQREQYIKMAGREVFKFAVRVMESSTKTVLEKAGISAQDVSWFVPHQANIRIIESAANRLSVPMERFVVNVDRYGNTSSGSIGIALDELARSGSLSDGDYVVLVGFGAGLAWASALLRWYERGENRG
ncbi:MAG: ketoacyl-ACP synthase III [Firmicutes bacterium]|nr:ketoacyl-ACP synthase III [Bacillota bacterium]